MTGLRRTLPPLRTLVAGLLALALIGCAGTPEERRTPYQPGPRPADAPPLTPLSLAPVDRSNATILVDFMLFVFEEESGDRLTELNKLREPIAVVFATPGFEPYRSDLKHFIDELAEASQIEVSLTEGQTAPPDAASRIHLRFVPYGEMDEGAPNAQCIFLPGAEPFWRIMDDDALFDRLSEAVAAADTTIYIPVNTPPDEVRECFYEEIMQALGPRNDLLHVPDSIFNDENAHSRPTPYDLLILRTIYHPNLRPEQPRTEVMAAVVGILDEVHPSGVGVSPTRLMRRTSRLDHLWREALDRDLDDSARGETIARALAYTDALPDDDYRKLVFRSLQLDIEAPDDAAEQFAKLATTYETGPRPDPLRAALMRAKQVSHLHSNERWSEIPPLVTATVDTLARAGRDWNVTRLYCSKARAEFAMEAFDSAFEASDLCAEWAAYTLGADHDWTLELKEAARRIRRGF